MIIVYQILLPLILKDKVNKYTLHNQAYQTFVHNQSNHDHVAPCLIPPTDLSHLNKSVPVNLGPGGTRRGYGEPHSPYVYIYYTQNRYKNKRGLTMTDEIVATIVAAFCSIEIVITLLILGLRKRRIRND